MVRELSWCDMARNEVVDIDRGWERISHTIGDAAKGAYVKVGVMGNESARDEGGPLDNVDIAIIHEFGAEYIPERSFLRSALDAQRSNLNEMKVKLWAKIVFGEVSLRRALALLGTKHRADVQERITELREPPLADATIARRRNKSDNPLVDTGQLRRSVNYEVVMKD